MAKPSLFNQVGAVAVSPHRLKPSPRHWNPGLLRYKGKLWLAYRYHLQTEDSRCGIAICPIDEKTFQPTGASQALALSSKDSTDHHEDCRLFMFRGAPHVSYTEMRGYKPGVDYTCCMKYARLRFSGNRWAVEEVFQPNYALNSGRNKEKNWVFFEHDKKLMCVYADSPLHVTLEIEREVVVAEHQSPPVHWEWGTVRGGSPPIAIKDGLLCFFHSSLATETPPHYVRYYAGAYVMEAKPPFGILRVMQRPLMSGSEEDGHRVDPRYIGGWKPYVVFPCGVVEGKRNEFLVSVGVNDWGCAIARVDLTKLEFGAPDGSDAKPRFFKTLNGSMPVRLDNGMGAPTFIDWTVPRQGQSGMVGAGYMRVTSLRQAEELLEIPAVTEIDEPEYLRANQVNASRFVYQ